MEEQGSEMEKIAETEALKQEVGEARTQIELDMKDPAQSTADAAGEVGIVKEMWDVMQKHGTTARELTWKDVKATAAGAISVIPLVGTLGNIGKAAEIGKKYYSINKAMKLNRSANLSENVLQKKNFIDALKRIPQNPIRLVADPLHSAKEAWNARKSIGEVGKTADMTVRLAEVGALGGDPSIVEASLAGKMADAQKAYSKAKSQLGKDVLLSAGLHLMHKIDPFSDVPPALSTIAGFAEFVLPGANIVPALWQLAHNKIEWAKMYGGLAMDMGKVVMKRFDGKMNEVKKPDVMRAAAVFDNQSQAFQG